MGFIPIFITLGGSVMLFILVVHQGIKSKRSQFFYFCQATSDGIQSINSENKKSKYDFEELKNKYQDTKSKLKNNQLKFFNDQVRKPYQQAKLIQSQHNKFIAKKPYSFVARLLGIQAI